VVALHLAAAPGAAREALGEDAAPTAAPAVAAEAEAPQRLRRGRRIRGRGRGRRLCVRARPPNGHQGVIVIAAHRS